MSALQYGDLQTYLPLDVLTKVDRMTMAHSIEARPPLLDHRLVEFAATIPPALRYRNGTTKYLFKQALRGVLPDEIIDRPKQGFAVPLARWFRGPLSGFARDVLLSASSRDRGVLNPAAVERLPADAPGRPRSRSAAVDDAVVRAVVPPVPRRAGGGRLMMARPRVAIVAASLDILGGQGVQAHTLVEALRADGYPVSFLADQPALPARASMGAAGSVSPDGAEPGALPAEPAAAGTGRRRARVLGVVLVVPARAGPGDGRRRRSGSVSCSTTTAARPTITSAPGARWCIRGSVWPTASSCRRTIWRTSSRVHGHRAEVIRNVVDLARFAYRERTPLRPRLVSTRNLEPYYRVDVVLEAFARVRAEVPGATLTVAGYGSEEARLRRLAGDGVRFVGKVDPESMPALLRDADIFVNASVVDNQPVSILEAFAAGLPVVSTPTGDIAAMVRHGETGLIVPPRDPGALAAAVLGLLRQPDRAARLARRARGEITRYTWSAVGAQWASAYDPESAVEQPVRLPARGTR